MENVNLKSLKMIKTNDTYMIKYKGHTICSLKYFDYKLNNFDWILVSDVETKLEYRRHGLAKRLIDELYADMSKKVKKSLYVFVDRDNRGAILFYSKIGFKLIKIYKMKSGSNRGEYLIMGRGTSDIHQFDTLNFS